MNKEIIERQSQDFRYFKVWDKVQRQFFELDIYTLLLDPGSLHDVISAWKGYDIIDKRLIWLRYSGKNDIKGNKIYHGDIVKSIDDVLTISMLSGIVEYKNGCFLVGSVGLHGAFEIVGNIFLEKQNALY